MDRELLLSGAGQPGGREPAPGGLALVQAFVNTVDAEHGPDLLDDAGDLAEWLARRDLPARVAPRDLAAAREVREALRTLLAAHVPGAELRVVRAGRGEFVARRAEGERAAAVLDAAAERAVLLPRFGPGRLEPRATGVDAALGAVLAAAFAAMADGTWRRLKACPGERCGWAFYDRSPSASAAWCSMQVCGGRAKARAYYARRSATSSPSRIDPSR